LEKKNVKLKKRKTNVGKKRKKKYKKKMNNKKKACGVGKATVLSPTPFRVLVNKYLFIIIIYTNLKV
jgi:hypothetical protein